MVKNVKNWQYKTKVEIEALNDADLIKLDEELTKAMKLFSQHKVEFTDEMVWQLMVVPGIMVERHLKPILQT